MKQNITYSGNLTNLYKVRAQLIINKATTLIIHPL